jgi:anti-sigma factor ChrR (cupin superfamily)
MVPIAFTVRALLVTSLMAAASAALGQEPALAFNAQAPELQWKPCPDTLPKGCRLAVLHGDPAKPDADVFLKLPGASKIPLHTHTSAERIVLVAGTVHITYEGQKMAVLQPGSYAYGPATKPHHAECVSRKPCILFIAFEAPVDVKLVPATPR